MSGGGWREIQPGALTVCSTTMGISGMWAAGERCKPREPSRTARWGQGAARGGQSLNTKSPLTSQPTQLPPIFHAPRTPQPPLPRCQSTPLSPNCPQPSPPLEPSQCPSPSPRPPQDPSPPRYQCLPPQLSTPPTPPPKPPEAPTVGSQGQGPLLPLFEDPTLQFRDQGSQVSPPTHRNPLPHGATTPHPPPPPKDVTRKQYLDTPPANGQSCNHGETPRWDYNSQRALRMGRGSALIGGKGGSRVGRGRELQVRVPPPTLGLGSCEDAGRLGSRPAGGAAALSTHCLPRHSPPRAGRTQASGLPVPACPSLP